MAVGREPAKTGPKPLITRRSWVRIPPPLVGKARRASRLRLAFLVRRGPAEPVGSVWGAFGCVGSEAHRRRPHWLRHTCAIELPKKFGLEAAHSTRPRSHSRDHAPAYRRRSGLAQAAEDVERDQESPAPLRTRRPLRQSTAPSGRNPQVRGEGLRNRPRGGGRNPPTPARSVDLSGGDSAPEPAAGGLAGQGLAVAAGDGLEDRVVAEAGVVAVMQRPPCLAGCSIREPTFHKALVAFVMRRLSEIVNNLG